MKALQGVLAAAAAAMLAGVASSREPNLGPLRAWTLPDYTVISPGELVVRDVIDRMSAMDRVLSVMLSPPPKGAGIPTYIYIVRASTWSRYLQPSTAISAEFVPTRFANYLLFDGGSLRTTKQLRVAASHEFTHLFLRTRFRGEYPLWFDEGLAKLMENTEIRGTVATVGQPQPDMGYPTIPLDRLLRVDRSSREYLSSSLTSSFHYQSWALVHQGLIADPGFGKQIFAYLKAINDLRPIDDAIIESFGTSIGQLSTKTAIYREQNRFKAGSVAIEAAPEVPLTNGRLLGPAVALESLAHLMLDTGLHEDRVKEVIAALDKQGDSTATAILRLRVAARARDDIALQRQIEALQPLASDARVARETGLAIFERVYSNEPGGVSCSAGERAHCERALELLGRSLTVRTADSEGAWTYGMLAASLGVDLDTALQRLQRAGAALPKHADIAMATALVHEARGDTALMIQPLLDTARFTSSVSQRQWAIRRIDTINLEKSGT